jgi:hypothetical protein
MLSDSCSKRCFVFSRILFAVLILSVLSPLSATANGGGSDSTLVSSTASELAEKEAALRKMLVDKAHLYVGIRYRYGGASPRLGFDCSGFTSYVMRHFNIQLDHSSRAQGQMGQQVKLSDARPGDLIVFRRSSRSSISHVSMVVSNSDQGVMMIHASSSGGVVVQNLNHSSYWKRRMYMVRDVVSTTLETAQLPSSLDDAALPAKELASKELSPEELALLTSLGQQIPYMLTR